MSKFKSIVRQAVVDSAQMYKRTFVDYEYLVCSPAFKDKPYYIIDAHEDNFEHLTGVTSTISPQEFYNRCMNNTLSEDDFDFTKSGQSVSEVKNFVKMKIAILPLLNTIFSTSTFVEEHFSKGRVICSFATSTTDLTLGFSISKTARPKSLLKGNLIKSQNRLELVLRKPSKAEKFTEICVGTEKDLEKYYDVIKAELDNSLIR